MKETIRYLLPKQSKKAGAWLVAASGGLALLGLNACGLFEEKDETQNDKQTQGPVKNDQEKVLPLTTASPANEAPINETEEIPFTSIEAAITKACKTCHANGTAPTLKTEADFIENRVAILAEIEQRSMPAYLPDGADKNLWLDTAGGQLVLRYIKQRIAAESPPAAPVPGPSAAPTETPTPSPEPPPRKIVFGDVAQTLETTCGICHAASQAPRLSGFADYQQNKTKILATLENKTMPPFLMSGEDPKLWTSAGAGKLVLDYLRQEGELVP